MLLEHFQYVSQYFVEGAICDFAWFKVEQCPASYRMVSHDFWLNFMRDTVIKSLPGSSQQIPFPYFEFVRLEDIGTLNTGDTKVVGKFLSF